MKKATKSLRISHRNQSEPFFLGDLAEIFGSLKQFLDTKSSNRLLWDMAIEQVTEKELSAEDDLTEEKNVIIAGNQNSGKSSIILRYTDR